ncbi:ankyrin repeat domain-containing protein [Candidatus Avelusimicrobium aviculae]|uniref:ankyrin repeat domain-containing protein n=1 Tax=Candidatus Avelusimicrobium aviculae TaxID=3416206 RepID=UPI003D098D48
MNKKITICIIILLVCALAWSYRQQRQEQLAATLIADAYAGDLIAVKNDLEDGAPLDYTLLFEDEERQYAGADFTALHAAASGGNEDIINLFLDEGLSIDRQTPHGWTPLFVAVRDGRAEAAKLLVFRGANPNIPTDTGATPLIMAVTQKFPTEKQRLDLVTYLLKRGADPNLSTQNGLDALFFAASYQKNPELVALLLEYGADTQTKNYKKLLKLLKTRTDKESKKIAALLQKAVKK